MTDQRDALALLRRVLKHAEAKDPTMSAVRYAREVLIRDDRTLRRWLAGDSPIPDVVVDFLEKAWANAQAEDEGGRQVGEMPHC